MTEDETILESDYRLNPMIITCIDGTKITIHPFHVDAFLKLRRLKPWQILDIMELSDDDVINSIEERKKAYSKVLIDLFDKQWETREDGIKIDFMDADFNEFVFGLRMTETEIRKTLKKLGKKMDLKQIIKMVSIFKSGEDFREIEK